MLADIREPVTIGSFQTVKAAMLELRSECADLESYVVGVFDQLEAVRANLAEREGDPALIDKIADETVCTEVDDLLVYLEETNHPAPMMDPIF